MILPATSRRSDEAQLHHDGPVIEMLPDLTCVQIVMVNVYFIGERGSRDWSLIDAGLPFSASRIIGTAKKLFGGAPPRSIILTHGHFDHVGALRDLLDEWDVPVYAHELELPYLTGRSEYPPPDPTVGGGMMARTSMFLPKGPFDFVPHIRALPEDGTLPTISDWRWLATPGHSPGHVSFWRQADRTLIAGDAFVTQKQESLIGILTQHQHVHGPPMYFTPDWINARMSVERLANLQPEVAATGHGIPMTGQRMRDELRELAEDFDQIALPRHGRYVHEPALTDKNGVIALPPPVSNPLPAVLIGALALGTAAFLLTRKSDD